MLKRNLRNSLCVTLSAISLVPQISCFAKEETTPKSAENKVEINDLKLKELKNKLKNITLKEWLTLAGVLGVPTVAALAIWKSKSSKNPSTGNDNPNPAPIVKPLSDTSTDAKTIVQNVLEKLGSVTTENLTDEEIKSLEKNLINGISDKNLDVLKIDKTKLDELTAYVLEANNGIDGICAALEQFYLESDESANIYDPQKRYVLSHIIYEASKLPDNDTNRNAYNKLFEVNEKINQKVILNALKDEDSPIEARKTIAHVLFLEHLGVLKFDYNKEKNEVRLTPKKEYTSSSLAYGETVMITLPYIAGSDINKKIFSDIDTDKWTDRTSSHNFDFNWGEHNGLEVRESKGNVAENFFNLTARLAGFTPYQKGININVTSKDKGAYPTGINGHILVDTRNSTLGSAALIKLESAAPFTASVFGHSHGASTGSNIISATCQFRPFSPHSKRSGILVNLAGLTTSELTQAIDDFDKVFGENSEDTTFLEKLTGSKMNEAELKQFLNFGSNPGKANSNETTENDYVKHAQKPLRFYENPENMKLISDSAAETGMMIFCDQKTSKYTYYIVDGAKFNNFIQNEVERNQIKANQLTPMPLALSITDMKSYSTIARISKTLKEYIENNMILDINHFNLFENTNEENKRMLDGIRKSAEDAKKDAYVIPGLKIYRYKGWVGSATYYGYFIENIKQFLGYCQGAGISDENAKKIYACQNWWFDTSGDGDLDIFGKKAKELLPKIFINHLVNIKEHHTLTDYKSSYVKNLREGGPRTVGATFGLIGGTKERRIFTEYNILEKLRNDSNDLGINGHVFDCSTAGSIETILKTAKVM